MAKYKLVSNSNASEQIFMVKYSPVKRDQDFTDQYKTDMSMRHDAKMLTMVEGKEYELTTQQVNDFLKLPNGSLNPLFELVIEEPVEE